MRNITSFRVRFTVLAFAMLSALLLAADAFADVTVKTGAPVGFEALEAPRQTVVTLYFGGNSLGSVPAHFAPGKLVFDKPADILAKIPAISDKDKVLAAISQPLDAHQDLICGEKRRENCGMLTPETAGVIFDENSLSAELFVNKIYLAVVDQNTDRFLPLPDQHFSSVSAFNGAVDGAGGKAPGYTLGNTTVLALGEGKLTTETTVANNGIRFDTAAASVERDGWNSTAGLFRSHAMQLLSDRDIAGVAYSTSAKTWVDSQKARGNDVIVYLPRRSYVSIYREGRLYSSQAYEAGNQNIDTSELPDGAYEITLKIQDSDGSVREEKRFFAKTQDIPPPDRPSYYVEGGLIRKPAGEDMAVPEITVKPILRAGVTSRVAENIGVNLSFLGVEDRGLMETGATWINSGAKLTATALSSTKGDFGFQTSYLQSLGDFNASLDLRKTWMAHSPIPGFEDISGNITEVSTTLSYMVTPDLSVGARGSYVRQDDVPLSTSVGPFAEWRLWSAGESALGLTLAAARTDHDNEASALLHFSYRFGDYTASGSAGASFDHSRGMPAGNLRLSHTDDTPGNSLTLGGGVSTDAHQQIVSTDADWRNNFGGLRGSVQEAVGRNSSGLGYGGNFNFNATQVDDEVHIGGDQQGSSAVIVTVDGDADTDMKIFVNNVERSHVAVGSKQVVYLSPYHTYNIRIAPVKNALLDYESSNKRVTVYSGNVVKLNWSVNKFYVVSARIVTQEGAPLVDATLRESRAQVVTDAHGRLQAELSAPKTLTLTDPEQRSCQVTLPGGVVPVNGVLLYPKPLSCIRLTEIASR